MVFRHDVVADAGRTDTVMAEERADRCATLVGQAAIVAIGAFGRGSGATQDETVFAKRRELRNELLFYPAAVGGTDVYLVDNKVDGTRISDKDAVGGLHLGIHILHEA